MRKKLFYLASVGSLYICCGVNIDVRLFIGYHFGVLNGFSERDQCPELGNIIP